MLTFAQRSIPRFTRNESCEISICEWQRLKFPVWKHLEWQFYAPQFILISQGWIINLFLRPYRGKIDTWHAIMSQHCHSDHWSEMISLWSDIFQSHAVWSLCGALHTQVLQRPFDLPKQTRWWMASARRSRSRGKSRPLVRLILVFLAFCEPRCCYSMVHTSWLKRARCESVFLDWPQGSHLTLVPKREQ